MAAVGIAVGGLVLTAGARATIKKHGVGYWKGITTRKGWQGRRRESLAVDLVFGSVLAEAA